MPLSRSTSTPRMSTLSDSEIDADSPSSSVVPYTTLPTMSHQHPNRDSRRLPALPVSSMPDFSPSATLLAMQRARPSYDSSNIHSHSQQQQCQMNFTSGVGMHGGCGYASEDLFHQLRKHSLQTKEAWTAIPSSEGFKILNLCRSMSATSSSPVSFCPRSPS
jgi:hypothetical protein